MFEEMEIEQLWVDGETVPWEDAQTHVLTHGLNYGVGVLEGVYCYDTADGPAMFRWDAHLERFYESAKPYGIEIEYTPEELTEATVGLIDHHGYDYCYVRPMAFFGYGEPGITGDCPVTVLIAVWPWDVSEYLSEETLTGGVDTIVSSWRKHAPSQVPTTAKTTGLYVNSFLARREAQRYGADEAFMLNKEGNVAEAATANAFAVADGGVYTPSVGQGILNGITRRSVIRIAEDLGYRVEETTLGRGELYTADEIFLTGTAVQITPVTAVDGVTIGDGTRGEITEAIQSRFFDIVNRDVTAYEEWFTYV